MAVDLRTDLLPDREFDAVQTELLTPGHGEAPPIEVAASAEDDFLTGLRVAELPELPLGDHLLEVRLLLGDEVVSTRPLRVVLRDSVAVTVLVTRECAGVACPAPDGDPSATACLAGRCVDAGCTPQTPELCPEPACREAADCAAAASCATATCEEGACLVVPDDAACLGGQLCDPEQGCSAVESAEPNLAFVTSTAPVPGELGGLEGADRLCNDLAEAAGLPREFVAWLSTPEVDAIDRLGNASGWVRTDGRPFAASLEELAAGNLLHPLRVDEAARDVGSELVMTGTAAGGVHDASSGDSCQGWTRPEGLAATGRADGTAVRFTKNNGYLCSRSFPIYCFGAARDAPFDPTPASGRVAFVTDGSWGPGGGLSDADDFCAAEAAAAGYDGVFRALLPTLADSAASRFDPDGATWVRPDGIPLADTAADVLAGRLQTSIGVTATGNYPGWVDDPDTGVRIGAASISSPATESCSDWTSTAGESLGVSSPNYSDGLFADGLAQPCITSFRIFCFEE